MRLFTGIALAPNVFEKLSAILAELKPTAGLNWSPIDNLHITLKFIGQWPDERLPELQSTLSGIPPSPPIPINVSRFGFFPNPHHPHSFFAGVHTGTQSEPSLTNLATAIDHALEPLGLRIENRDYHPHVTLARIKGNPDLRALREHIATLRDFEFGNFDAREFHLYLSQPATRGSVYTKLATYDLMRENN